MRTKYVLAFSMAVAALLLPRAARAQSCQEGACEAWAYVDPSSGTIYGGVYYENYEYGGYVQVQAIMWDPDYFGDDLGGAVADGYAEVDFSGYLPDMGGTFTLGGENSYMIEDDPWTGDGWSIATVYAAPPAPTQDPTPVIQGMGPSPPWQAGQTYDFGVWGTGFGTNPTLTIQWNDMTSYSTQCSGQYCDAAIGGTVTVPGDATDGTITVTSNGYNGSGFLPGPGNDSPTSNSYDVPLTSATGYPSFLVVTDDRTTTYTGYVARTLKYQFMISPGVQWNPPGGANTCENLTPYIPQGPGYAPACTGLDLSTVSSNKCSIQGDWAYVGSNGQLTDTWSLNSGYSPSGCGYSSTNSWNFVASGVSPVKVAELDGYVHTDAVQINGSTATGGTSGQLNGKSIGPNGNQ